MRRGRSTPGRPYGSPSGSCRTVTPTSSGRHTRLVPESIEFSRDRRARLNSDITTKAEGRRLFQGPPERPQGLDRRLRAGQSKGQDAASREGGNDGRQGAHVRVEHKGFYLEAWSPTGLIPGLAARLEKR